MIIYFVDLDFDYRNHQATAASATPSSSTRM